MNSEQLQKTRQEHWRQDGKPLLTLEDAEQWLNENQLCLFLPRRAHLPVPAPSFAEAIGGKADATPSPETLAQARQLMARLVASGAAVPLNLFGTPGEHPDFLTTPEALMFLYALQGERNPKHGPQSSGAGRVSPLAVEVWKVLEREGALTTDELRERVGREITEAAVLRALSELWHGLRVAPAPGENDEPAQWEPLSARHRKVIASGSTQSQTTALSMLVSYYLRSAIIATGEEIELFLSPVTSRSRVRDVLRGLSANRQLGTLSLGTQMHFYVEGTLPEFVEEEIAAMQADAGLEGNEPDVQEVGGDIATRGPADSRGERTHAARPPRGARPLDPSRRSTSERPGFGDRAGTRPSFGQRAKRPSFGERSKRPFGAREGSARARPARPPFRRAAEAESGNPPRAEHGAEERGVPRRGGFSARDSSGARPVKRFGGVTGPSKSGRFSKPFNKPVGAKPSGMKPRGAKPGGASFRHKDSESGESGARPPFRGAGGDRPQRPGFTRGEPARPGAAKFGAGSRRPEGGFSGERPQRSQDNPQGRPHDRPQGRPQSFGRREGVGPRGGEGRPPQRRQAGGAFGARGGGARKESPPRRSFGDRTPEGSFTPRPSGGRPPFSRGQGRPPAGADARTFKPRSFKPRGEEGTRPPRREGDERPTAGGFGDKGSGFKPRAPRRGGDRPSFPRREGRPAEGAGNPRTFMPRGAEGARPPRREGGFGKGAGSAGAPYKSRGAQPKSGPASSGPGSSGPKSYRSRPPAPGPGGAPRGAAGRNFGAPKRGGFKPGTKPGGAGAGGFKPPKRKAPRRPSEGDTA